MTIYPNMVHPFLSESGSCLTVKNWEEVGITVISCALEALLFKPGIKHLLSIQNFKKWLGWNREIVLNAQLSSGFFNTSLYQYELVSPWDGSRLTISIQTLSSLIKHLKPDYVILPREIIEDPVLAGSLGWPDTRFPESPFVETDEPVLDGFDGKIYTKEGKIDIKDSTYTHQFNNLDKNCFCPTCKQGFTRAYLHHLLENTPLLAQRLLIMHNIFWMKMAENAKCTFT